jgi:hypothetical protein
VCEEAAEIKRAAQFDVMRSENVTWHFIQGGFFSIRGDSFAQPQRLSDNIPPYSDKILQKMRRLNKLKLCLTFPDQENFRRN